MRRGPPGFERQQPLEIAVLEDQDEDPEHGAEAEEVHQDRFDRQHERPGEQEQDDQCRGDYHREDSRQMGAETVLEIEVGGGLAGDAEVDRRTDRADVTHELLGRAAERPRGDATASSELFAPAGCAGATADTPAVG